MTQKDLQQMSAGAEELQQMAYNRAVHLMENDNSQHSNKIDAMLEIGHDSHPWDALTPACVSAAADTQTAVVSPTGRENVVPHNPEVCNTGLSTYHTAEVPSFPSTEPLQSGGYDGGTENAFFGQYDSRWTETLKILEKAKVGAQQQARGLKHIVVLGGENVMVHPWSKTVGNNKYHYVVEWGGYDLKIWGDPEKPPTLGHVRVMYRAEILLEYGIDEAQRRLLDWLSRLGFTLHPEFGERLARVDVNVCVPISVGEFASLIRDQHHITVVRKDGEWRGNGEVETYFIGSRTRIQMKIYDKRVELANMPESTDFRKYLLTVQRCIGDEWLNSTRPITRVEFSISRDVLKGFGIESLAEFRTRERDFVDLLTKKWFRILAEPKVRGHENTASMHPHWEVVRAEFLRCFDGSTALLERVEKHVSIDMKRLGQQLAGIATKMVAFKHGNVVSLTEFRLLASGILRELLHKEHFEKLQNIVAAFETQTGGKLGITEGLDEFKDFEAD